MANLRVLAKEPSWGIRHRIPTATNFPNTLTVTEPSGVSNPAFPHQIYRSFMQGEIPDYPEVLLDSSVHSNAQCNVETRYSDGSVRQAIIYMNTPLSAYQTRVLSFTNKASQDTTPLSKATILADWDFDCVVTFTQGATSKSVSARTMLQNNHYDILHAGPVATTYLFRDHSVARTYDKGFDAYNPLRTMFYVTFFPISGHCRIRWVVESCLLTELHDVTANIAVTSGYASPTTVYTESNVAFVNAMAYSRQFWMGTDPGNLTYDYNIAWLGATKATFNFDNDAAFAITESTVASRYTQYQGWTKTLRAINPWYWPNNDTGGRPDLCMTYATWFAQALCKPDWRMRKMAEFAAEQFTASSQIRFREGDATKKLYGTVDGIGRVISVKARPNMITNYNYRNVGTEISPCARPSGISIENEHAPFVYGAMYVLTGEYYWLECLQMHGASEVGQYNYRASGYAMPALTDNRARGRCTRNRFEAYLFTPDGTPEKEYFRIICQETIDTWEGLYRITSSPAFGTAPFSIGYFYATTSVNYWEWSFWRTTPNQDPPLKFQSFTESQTPGNWYPCDETLCDGMQTTWMAAISVISLSRAADAGLDCSRLMPIVTFPFVDAPVNNPIIASWMFGTIQSPAFKEGGVHPTTWDEVQGMLLSGIRNTMQTGTNSWHVDHTYSLICRMAATFGTTHPQFLDAMAWFDTWIYNYAKSINLQNPGQCLAPRVS